MSVVAPKVPGLTEPEEHRGTLRVLTLARNYPNRALPQLGLWTQRLVQGAARFAEIKVISPVPYAPPLPSQGRLAYYTQFRRVMPQAWHDTVEVIYPRMLTGPGYSMHSFEAAGYALATMPAVRRLRSRFTFDIIHAHFGYPDGVVACLLGRRYDVPVVITEQAPWLPWLQQYPLVRRQAVWAARTCAVHIAVSQSLRQSIEAVTGQSGRVTVIPNAVDGDLFQLETVRERVPGQILFVGAVRYCKGVDVLLNAMGELRTSHPEAHLVLAGAPFYAGYRREAERLQMLARDLGLDNCVSVLGGKSPAEIATLMSESAVLALPSRAETFGAVLIEALACGTPVVATRSGGPEEIVTPAVGHIVPVEDSSALAAALADVLDHPGRYDRPALRRHALQRYGLPVVAAQLLDAYTAALHRAFKPNGAAQEKW